MKLSIVLSTQPAQFQAATFKGDLETNLHASPRWAMTGSSWPSVTRGWSTWTSWSGLVRQNGLSVPAIGTGQAWGEEGLSFTDPDPASAGRPSSGSRATSRSPPASGR